MKRRILTVDDSESIVTVIQTTLEEEYDVLGVLSGNGALEALGQHQDIDLVITDLNMPGMDGIELIKSIRGMECYKLTPILMLTTESQMQKKQEAKEAGATGWIVKPFEAEKLKAVIKKVLR